MGHWARECRSKPKAEGQAHVAQEESTLLLLEVGDDIELQTQEKPAAKETSPTARAVTITASSAHADTSNWWKKRCSPFWTPT